MLFLRKFTSHEELRAILNGTPVASGDAGTNTAGSPNFQDLTPGAFADVSVGDRIYISGESVGTVFLVDTKTDDNNLVLDNNIVAEHTLTSPPPAVWRAVKNDAIPEADIKFGGPIGTGPFLSQGLLVYESDTFGV